MPVSAYLYLAAIIFTIGLAGVLLKRNALILMMSVELMLNAANLTFLAFARQNGTVSGHAIAFFVIAVAAAEAAVGLAIVIAIFRSRGAVNVDEVRALRGVSSATMLARCARCQGTFSTDRYGRQVCPHCGAELILPAPAGSPEAAAPPPGGEPPRSEAPPPQPPGAAAPPPPAPPPPAPPPAGFGPPGWPPPPGGGWGGPPSQGGGWGGPPSDGGLPSPFADRARLGFVSGFLETWKLVATQPERFFARVRTDQTWTAILFGVIASTIGTLFSSIYAYFSSQQALVAIQQMVEKMPEEQAKFVRMYAHALTGNALVAQVILAPVLTFIGIYVAAGIVHLVLLLLKGGQRGFDATLTAVAYTTGLALLFAVPACGSLIAGVWELVVLVIGLGAIQRCGSGKAAAAVLAPLALACVCCCGLAGAGVTALLKGAAAAKGTPPTTDL
jgi:NADH:ubiquinone oxidoreductase subunit K/DNA-directed RNA polymerase subunit RPC12/RpoP